MNVGKVNIFISSTCYDLSQIRKDLCEFIIGLGHNPILSEQNGFPIDPRLDNWENCINAVKKYADVFVLIIGSKYGSVGDTGKSITNTEYLTAIQKGIPIYTFALKEMTTLLPIWEHNPAADFSYVVDNNKVFEFLADVRKKSGLWNFEFETAQDIMETLRKQLSILFQSTLKLRKKIVSSPYEDLYSRISSKALNILMQEEEGYDIRFFMQVMQDGIMDYHDLRNDYRYSIILKPINRRRNLDDFFFWLDRKLDELWSYIDSLHKLSDTFKTFYKENDDDSDIRGLHYVASTYAEFYRNFLKWGIEIKGMMGPDECKKLMEVLAEMPSFIIEQMEQYPAEVMNKIPLCIEKGRQGTLEKEDLILFPFKIEIPQNLIDAYKKEMDNFQSLMEEREKQ
ncbi:MAG: DUF4062 domain-containing protein [Prevotellaceae bacterium]|nr:DUF4062 domain-containing protein [Prevotellaceae bacterium]